MDLFNRNENRKRKLSQSIERDENLNIENEQSVGCFRRCCKRKKHQIMLDQNDKRKKTTIEKTSHLARSPLFTETTFCQVNDDPCLQCNVQYGPDSWENTPKCSRKRSANTDKVRLCSDTFHCQPYVTIFSLWPRNERMNRKMYRKLNQT